jgi:hypothetical protein
MKENLNISKWKYIFILNVPITMPGMDMWQLLIIAILG